MYCCPKEYFHFSRHNCIEHDIYNINYDIINKNDVVILGGGGLFDCLEEWNQNINKVLDKCNNCFAWGVGFNKHNDNSVIKTQINFQKFTKITVRDFNHNLEFEFCPCVSCMVQFPKNLNTSEVGIVEHKDYKINIDNYPKIQNNVYLVDLLNFIAKFRVVVTNTYHGWYWATLMNKKVILFNSFSSKFNWLPWKPVIYSGNLQKDIAVAKVYPRALKIARRKNKALYICISKKLKNLKKIKSLLSKFCYNIVLRKILKRCYVFNSVNI